MIPTSLAGVGDLLLPPHRAARLQWPWHERPRLLSMRHNLRPDDRLYDVGSEQGDQSALYRTFLPLGRLVLLEPNPAQWPCARVTFEANDLPPPDYCFVGYASDHTHVDAEDRLAAGWPRESYSRPCAENVVTYTEDAERDPRTVRIDDLADLTQVRPTAVTVDVEGWELEVLAGARRVLGDDQPLLWVSVHVHILRDRGRGHEDVLDLLRDAGYRWELLGEDHELHVFAWSPHADRPPVLPYGGLR